MSEQVVTVFGGTGFLGRRVVQSLAMAGKHIRIAARNPSTSGFSAAPGQLEAVAADIRDDQAVASAVDGATAVVNAVSLYVEKGELTFEAVHVEGAERVARCGRSAGVQSLVHVSGIGVDRGSPSKFVRARARGEKAVISLFEEATVVRPSVMFACGEAFLQALENVTRLPVVPLFGQGDTRLQPAFVEDVAGAIARLIELQNDRVSLFEPSLFELGGNKVYTYRQAVQAVAARLGRKRMLMPLPFPAWHAMVSILKVLPNPPLTRDQLVLMESDNVVGPGVKTFRDLGIKARSLEDLLEDCYPRN